MQPSWLRSCRNGPANASAGSAVGANSIFRDGPNVCSPGHAALQMTPGNFDHELLRLTIPAFPVSNARIHHECRSRFQRNVKAGRTQSDAPLQRDLQQVETERRRDDVDLGSVP